MPTIHLIEGPVGAGKSTFAAQLSVTHSAPRLNLDEWMATLFRADRPSTEVMSWYEERKQRCIEQIWQLTCDLIDTGNSAVLELGLIRQQDRADFYSRTDATDCVLKVYVLDAPQAVRQQRIRQRNDQRGSTYRMDVPDEFFELASNLWQPPDEVECRERDIEFISTG